VLLAPAWRRRLPEGDIAFTTVLDDRGPLTTLKAFNVATLAATWARRVRFHSRVPLIVHVVRPRHDALLRWLESLDIEIVAEGKPHFLNEFSGTYNKLLAILAQKKTESRILVDNDVAFVGDVPGLLEDARRSVMASVADKRRAPQSVIDAIRDHLALRLIDEAWQPWQDKYEVAVKGQPCPKVRGLYFNSGVVTSPQRSRLMWIWQRHSRLISRHFAEDHPGQSQRDAFGSDQLSLSTAIQEHGGFNHLPVRYNYRAFNFRLGELDGQDIAIVHQVGMGRHHDSLPSEQRLDPHRLVEHYYDQFILNEIRGDALGEKSRREAAALAVKSRLLDALSAGGLEDLRELGTETPEDR
jgi:hypothetical protein